MHTPPVSIPIPTTTTSKRLYTLGCRVARLSLAETTGGGAAKVEIYDGSNDQGTLVSVIDLASGTSYNDHFKMYQFPIFNGLYLKVVSGSVKGSVTVIPKDAWDHWADPVVILTEHVNIIDL